MTTIVEPFTSFTDFTAGNTAALELVNQLPEYIAGNTLTASLMFKFMAAGDYVEKVFASPVNTTGYDELVFSVYSVNRQYSGVSLLRKPPAAQADFTDQDFAYKIDFGGAEYYVPIGQTLHDVTIRLQGTASITRVRITALRDGLDYLVLSNLVANIVEVPVDIWEAVQERVSADIAARYPDGLEVGMVSAAAGATSITITGDRYFLEKYAVVKIKSVAGEEYHQLGENNNKTYKLIPSVSSGALTYTHAGAQVYLQLPVNKYMGQDDIQLPSCSLAGMNPEPVLRGSELDEKLDTFKVSGTVLARRDARIQFYRISLNVQSRSLQLCAIISQFVRDFIGREVLWVGGRKFELVPGAPPTEVEPAEGINDVWLHTYEFGIEVKEELGTLVELPLTTTFNTTVNPVTALP